MTDQEAAVSYAAELLHGISARFAAEGNGDDAEMTREAANWLARSFPGSWMPMVERPAGDEPAPEPS